MSNIPFDTFEVTALPGTLTHWRNAFDSRYLRFTALEGRPRVVTIVAADWLKSSQKRNPKESKRQLLLTLKEFEKPWATNVTNCETMEVLFGTADPKEWVGRRLTLFPTKTRSPSGELVGCMRVRDQLPDEHDGNRSAQRQNAGNAAPAQQQPKRERTARERTWLLAMSNATTLEQLGIVEDGITNDNELGPEESASLARQLVRRQQQLAPATGATPPADQGAAS
jgi:hypothetical protein